MSDLPWVSVVVCTRNRSQILAQSSAALLAIDYPADRWEVLIVDNCSTDDTLAVAQEIARGRPDLVRVIEERELGLSATRNAGIRHARGEIIAFADDDAFPESAWLRMLVEALLQEDALVVGGPVEPWFQGQLPAWFTERYLVYVTAWDKGPGIQPLTYNEYPRGANIAFRREVFERFGYFSTHLGYKGNSLVSCDEIELCLRVERGGGRILYVPGARVRHITAAERITPRWLARRFAGQSLSEAILDWQHAGWKGLRRGLPWFYRHAVQAARQKHLPPDGEIFARCWRHALAGYFLGSLRAPLTVPRYRPPEGTAADWLPRA
ncbi:MAG TPA: glycosyltransferase [Thermoanaerobaculia bacterium]|nr:glycosyltransferase [Thermoanaerobaculia bacterium]